MELVEILINFVLIYMVVRVIFWLVFGRKEAELEQDLETLVDRMVDGMLVLVTVEVDQNQYLCYNSTTNEFICQGSNIREISANFFARFPAKKLAIYNGDVTAVETLNTQLEELRNENRSSK
jgi:hypothetical protein